MLDQLTPRFTAIETALGAGFVAYTARGVAVLSIGADEGDFLAETARLLGLEPVWKDPPASFRVRLSTAIARGDGTVVDWTHMKPFQRAVLQATAAIPYGTVQSYADVAAAIGSPRAMRAVGTALARNPVPLLVPCHRVVRADGSLGNYGLGGDAAKRLLLEAEGALSLTDTT